MLSSGQTVSFITIPRANYLRRDDLTVPHYPTDPYRNYQRNDGRGYSSDPDNVTPRNSPNVDINRITTRKPQQDQTVINEADDVYNNTNTDEFDELVPQQETRRRRPTYTPLFPR